jgi:maltose O-acetyltransferase
VNRRRASIGAARPAEDQSALRWVVLRRTLLGRNYRARRWHFLVNTIGGSFLLRHGDRARIYRAVGIRTATVDIRPSAFFVDAEVSFGAGTFVNHRCYFSSWARIDVGRDCSIANEVMFGTVTHEIGSSDKRAGEHRARAISVGDGCWIGARAQILPGVTIGHGCVVAAGSVVTSDCPADTLVAGVPATVRRQLGVNGARSERELRGRMDARDRAPRRAPAVRSATV